ncbi:hypothetical protein TWF281_001355 [Arthrobotrys megalospora]
MTYHQIDPFYMALMAEKCMKDHEIIKFIVDRTTAFLCLRKYSPDHPRQIDDIHVQYVAYDSRTEAIPSWLYLKHEILPDVARRVRECYQRNDDCHGTMEDHINLIMKTIWGTKSIVPSPEENYVVDQFREILVDYIKRDSPYKLPVFEKELGRLMLSHDLRVMDERSEWRQENADIMIQSMIGDGGTFYIRDQARKLLNPEKKTRSRKTNADELLYKLGWEKDTCKWSYHTVKANSALDMEFSKWKLGGVEEEDEGEEAPDTATETKEVVKCDPSTMSYSEFVKIRYGIDLGVSMRLVEENTEKKKDEKGKSVAKRIGVGILRFMKIKK